MRSIGVVKEFKKALVKAFFDLIHFQTLSPLSYWSGATRLSLGFRKGSISNRTLPAKGGGGSRFHTLPSRNPPDGGNSRQDHQFVRGRCQVPTPVEVHAAWSVKKSGVFAVVLHVCTPARRVLKQMISRQNQPEISGLVTLVNFDKSVVLYFIENA
jgi:hypothetical protein